MNFKEYVINEKVFTSKSMIETLSKNKKIKTSPAGKINFVGSEDEFKEVLKKTFPNIESITILKVKEQVPNKFIDKKIINLHISDKYKTAIIEFSNGSIFALNFLEVSDLKTATPAAADYELGIAVAYNMENQGIDFLEAAKLAGIDNKNDLNKFETMPEILEVGKKVIEKLPNVGPKLMHTGKLAKDVSHLADTYPTGSGKTPKTDILGDENNHISLKEKNGSQLMSGKANKDAAGVLNSALIYYDSIEPASVVNAKNLIDKMMNAIELSSNISVTHAKKTVKTAFVEWRFENLKKETKTKTKSIIMKHINQEAILGGFGQGSFKETSLLPDVKPLDVKEIQNWFKDFQKTLNSQMAKDIDDIIQGGIFNKELDTELNNLMQDKNLKKWTVFEAATGLYKFGETTEIKNIGHFIPAANTILVFSENGLEDYLEITPKWAEKKADHVSMQINFKSANKGKYTAIRMLQESCKEMVNKEFEIINEEVENAHEIMNEGIVSFSKKLFQKGYDLLKNVFAKIQNLIIKIIDKIKTTLSKWASEGFNYLVEKLGFEIYGEAKIDLSF